MNYKDSGVDINKGRELAQYLGFKDFGATIKIGGEQVVMSTDGVGTKLLMAEYYDKFDTIGIDLVAMCVNDILCKFAKPISFLDYYATGKLDLEKSKQILDGILKGCDHAGCELVGGETAEMPDIYQGTNFDLAGFVMGTVIDNDKDTTAQSGDHLVGIKSSGPHSNGFSLLRKILPMAAIPLTPTRIYTNEILNNHDLITNVAHITGGGLHGNIPRMLGGLDYKLWNEIPRHGWWRNLLTHSKMDITEFENVFNCGWGMVMVVKPDNWNLLKHSFECEIIGKVI